MGFSQLENELLQKTKNTDYFTLGEVENYKKQLEAEGNLKTFRYAFNKFIDEECPNCGVKGRFRYRIFGLLKHPQCSYSWYMKPSKYIILQLEKSFNAGESFAADLAYLAEKKGEKSSCLELIFSFIIGTLFRLVFAIISIPIQIILYLTNNKPNH